MPWHRRPSSVRPSIVNFDPWGRNRVYVQLLALWPMAKFHAQIWPFWKFACISETAAPRVKISSISTPGLEREYMWKFGKWLSRFSSLASRPIGLLFRFSKILDVLILMTFSFLWEWNFRNATLPTVVILFVPNFFYIFPVTVLTKLLSLNFDRTLNFLKKMEIFVNMGPHGSENFETLLLQLLFFFNQTFWECSLWQPSQTLFIEILKFQIFNIHHLNRCQTIALCRLEAKWPSHQGHEQPWKAWSGTSKGCLMTENCMSLLSHRRMCVPTESAWPGIQQ